MPGAQILDKLVFDNVFLKYFWPWFVRCRPRILVVTDGALNYYETGFPAHFGLTRFVQAISQSSLQPLITLAHRSGSPSPVSIYGTSYPVLTAFKFDTAATAVTVANYDEIWMFGFDGGNLPAAEVQKIADFMNAGGGVFATGDHASLGQAMGGQLPRVRHMREWSSIPMGSETGPIARDRIDTIVDPGVGGVYDFDDQSDEIPQRIYPNYDVAWNVGTWTATLHPLLRLPGAPLNRTDSSGFVLDIDVLPDHAHESVCYEVSPTSKAAALNGAYNVAGVGSFQEFPSAASGPGRIGSKIVAFGVSGGRSVQNGVWKPPVNPRMFGIISAFDGHAGAPYAGTARPGRIVCDSTWHHFVNINLDGTNSGRNALGLGSGVNFLPSIHLQKIYQYYKNIVDWLMPANRIWCWFWIHWVWLRFHPRLIEELVEVRKFKDPSDFEGLGRDALRVLDTAYGTGRGADAIATALRLDPATAPMADNVEAASALAEAGDRFVAFIAGKALAYVAQAIPHDDPVQAEKLAGGERHERFEQALAKVVSQAAAEGLAIQAQRAETRLRSLVSLRSVRPGRPD